MINQNLTLKDLKELLEKKGFKVEITSEYDEEIVSLQGFEKPQSITLRFSRFSTNDELNGKRFVSIRFNYSKTGGGGIPCKTIEEVFDRLNLCIEKLKREGKK